jgi:hypothetical protein
MNTSGLAPLGYSYTAEPSRIALAAQLVPAILNIVCHREGTGLDAGGEIDTAAVVAYAYEYADELIKQAG